MGVLRLRIGRREVCLGDRGLYGWFLLGVHCQRGVCVDWKVRGGVYSIFYL